MFSQIHLLVDIYSDENIDVICRLISLRKYIELTEKSDEKDCAYDIISCALHAKKKPDKKIGIAHYEDLSDVEMAIGTEYIKKRIPVFSYNSLINENLSLSSLITSYESSACNFFKLHFFRLILELDNNKEKIKDDNLLNYIDKTYHVENNYIYNLDFRKFEMIPEYIIKKCDDFIRVNYR